MAAIAAGEDRAVVRPGEDRPTVGLDEERVDVLVGQRPGGDVPTRTIRITLDARHPLNSADQHLLGGYRRTIDGGPAMRQGYSHGHLLYSNLSPRTTNQFSSPILMDPGTPGPYMYPTGAPGSPATPYSLAFSAPSASVSRPIRAAPYSNTIARGAHRGP